MKTGGMFGGLPVIRDAGEGRVLRGEGVKSLTGEFMMRDAEHFVWFSQYELSTQNYPYSSDGRELPQSL